MAFLISQEVKQQKVPLDTSKIERHPVEIKSLELSLEQYDSSFSAELNIGIYQPINGFRTLRGHITDWENENAAKAEFAKIAEAFVKGKYKIHLYEDGHVKVDVQYQEPEKK